MFEVSQSDIEEGSNGICLSCGQIQYGGIEPDAKAYECDSCGKREVYGLEEALIMGTIDLADDDGIGEFNAALDREDNEFMEEILNDEEKYDQAP